MNKELILSQFTIENRILTIRGVPVMLDRDLAEMYRVEVKRLNEQVKRNMDRFPEPFRFQLNDNEKSELVANCDRFGSLKHSPVNPYAFSEQGVAMLSAVLRSDIAVKVSIQIINTFVAQRKILSSFSGLSRKVELIEHKQLETDQKIEQVFQALENKNSLPEQGIFFDGQVFDAYELTSKIIRSARQSIVLIDNYIDEATFTHLAKKGNEVHVLLLTKSLSSQLTLDMKKANEQYGNFQARVFTRSHDRFLIIDGTEVYHLGASLKDLGKKWFAFSKMDKGSVAPVLEAIS
ncbi:MAG: ORF6N domain-containing protein [Leadbetterella sp.]|nr:ORF6N domain-containing protein [Leadbetterella sp.]